MKTIFLKLIRLYQIILSPWVGNQCRFYPTCSNYAKEAIEKYGVIKGGYLGLKRLLRCHPWGKGPWIDPVP
ncbi:MAG: membrane protein insertion efficiency factor YidD [Alphaproteobacteria bacterium]|nr:membrane protein insertion efficiency factor YidD [Alphaproteobacteria bacterium]